MTSLVQVPDMKINRKILAAGCIAQFMFYGSTVSAVEIYKWAGPGGVTHYAESPPDSDLASLEVLNVVVVESSSPAIADYQSVLDVASSIEASRLKRERARLEREKLVLQARQQRLAQQQYYDNTSGANVYYLPYSRGRHHYKPDPHNYGRHPVPAPHNNGGQSHNGSAPGRVNLSR